MDVNILSNFYFVALCFVLQVESFDLPGGMPPLPDIPQIPGMPEMPDMSVLPLTAAGISGEVREAIKTCRQQMKLSPDEALKIVTQDTTSSTSGECFLACVKKEIGIIGEDNTYNMDKIQEILAPLENVNPEVYAMTMSAFEDCIDAGADVEDYCAKAKKLRECVKAKRSGI